MAVYTKEKSQPLEEMLANFYKNKNQDFEPTRDDIFEFAKSLGFRVWKLPLDEESLDGIILVYKNKKKIGLNENLDLVDARFVLAHELAHYIKQFSERPDRLLVAERDRVFHGDQKKPFENDMDYLAAALLVPKDAFTKDLLNRGINLQELKDVDIAVLRKSISSDFVQELVNKYFVSDEVIYRRIAEVAYYV